MKTRSAGFWALGLPDFLGELAREESTRLAELEARLNRAKAPAEKAAIADRIEKLHAEYQKKRRNARSSLFARS